MERVDLINVYLQGMHIGLDVSMGLIVVVVIVLGLLLFLKFGTSLFDSFSPEIELNVPLGGLGSISIKTDYAVAQIAYTAWAELITRKAGLPLDTNNDVIGEVYASWYELFGKIRELIKTVPAKELKKENTKKLVVLLVDTLNKGLRPHLTLWQAKFNKWYKSELEKEENKAVAPQVIQRNFPEYNVLMSDLLLINGQLVEYTNELKKIVKLENK